MFGAPSHTHAVIVSISACGSGEPLFGICLPAQRFMPVILLMR